MSDPLSLFPYGLISNPRMGAQNFFSALFFSAVQAIMSTQGVMPAKCAFDGFDMLAHARGESTGQCDAKNNTLFNC